MGNDQSKGRYSKMDGSQQTRLTRSALESTSQQKQQPLQGQQEDEDEKQQQQDQQQQQQQQQQSQQHQQEQNTQQYKSLQSEQTISIKKNPMTPEDHSKMEKIKKSMIIGSRMNNSNYEVVSTVDNS